MNLRTALAAFATALVLLFMSIPDVAAQLTTGTVSGTVKDAQGGVIPGATISIISETRGTQIANVSSESNGDFVVPNLSSDTYTVQISAKGFKTLRRTGIAVSAGDRVGLGPLIIEVGALSEVMTVTSEAPLLQTQSAERSFTIADVEVQNLPLSNRNFTSLTAVLPGVTGTRRVGDVSSNNDPNSNIMMDGISTMDSGNNATMIATNTESIAEIKVLVSSYQAEYGRASGLQISSVTKSGTNGFHGTGFMIMRRSGWNANSKTNILNGDPRATSKQNDLGFTIGGPIGKPSRNNKLFFFYSHEFDPRSATVTGQSTVTYRFPTALERAGDFSKSTDNLGNPYPYIKDPLVSGPCSASNTAACFKDGGVLGKIPSDRLYSLGLKILSLYPMPNLNTPGLNYNYKATLPVQDIMSQAPIMKFDYQPMQRLRGSFKLSLWEQPANVQKGTLPGFNDTSVYKKWFYTWASTVTYNVNSTTFVEGTFGRSRSDLAGCYGPSFGAAPSFCTSSIPMNPVASLAGAGLTDLPSLFPDSGVLKKSYYAYQAMQTVKSPIWDGTRMSLVPQFSWGGRVANGPPNFPFPGWLNSNQNTDVSISLTKVKGRHLLKSGFYLTHSLKAQQSLAGTWQGSVSFANDVNNSLDSGFGFANAALGVFSSYSQLSKYIEGKYVFNNIEAFVQDNWKINSKLTLDYGIRFVHQQPQYDSLGQGVNFLPEKWSLSDAPLYYLAGCATTAPCVGVNRQAKDPLTGKLLGPNTSVAIGTLVPDSGNRTNGLFASGTNPVPRTTYNWPTLRPAPRFGIAYDVTGKQKIILRGGGGLFYDRPATNTVLSLIANPPNEQNQTLYYSQFQKMGGLTTQGAPNLSVYKLNSGLPSTWTWNAGVQYMLPFNTMLDVSYSGEHAYNIIENVNINTVDIGSAYLPANQDPTITSSLPGGAAVTQNMMRGYRGYGNINMMLPRNFFNSHTLQVTVNRRFAHGLQFRVSDTIMLKRYGASGARIQHAADGGWSYRSDQEQANTLLTDYIPTRHTFKGDFVWSIPGLKNVGSGFTRQALKEVTSDWQLSGVWSANTATAYTVSASFQNGAGNQTITGSPDFGGRVKVIGNPGGGCDTSNPYRQFNTSAFAPPAIGSVGLESGMDYLRGCFYQQFDFALLREFRQLRYLHLGEGPRLSIRLDVFNAFNQSHITLRNTNMQVTSHTNPAIVNLPFDSNGNLIPTRSQPRTAGFGMANGYQGARTLQGWLRFTF